MVVDTLNTGKAFPLFKSHNVAVKQQKAEKAEGSSHFLFLIENLL
ncbi:hypothetical protein [Komagataeibacter xylinus]|nr:hypothetical protein [Komagataeibacter xylinus]